jgi:S-DNA-T family DNA segregation ATPase FtsK/SpoIIIE
MRRAAPADDEGLPEAGQLALLGADGGVAPYLLPNSDLLKKSAIIDQGDGRGDRETADLLLRTLADFGVVATVVGMVVGPRVTRYELQLAAGTKVGKVAGLKDDLAYALASTEIRILAPIPGKQAVGVEVPNRRPSFVTLGDIYRDFPKTAGPLMVWLGKDISGKPVYADLAKMPHLLIAGTTGSGKSGCVNCIISSVLLRATPAQVKMILIDPKKVELSHYERIPHLLVPVVTNMKNAAGVLANVVKEMDNRYELMELERSRQLDEMNQRRAKRGESPLPYILVVIDELADLMMVAPADVEEYIIRVAQKARAVGIHLVVATQRPSVDVITGMIKANIPSRIAFAVSSQTDSRVILDSNGAEALLGMGDMLFRPLGSNRLQRVQGAFITEEEIALLVAHTRRQAQPEFNQELLAPPTVEHDDEEFDPDEDDLLVDAAELVLETGSASVSMLQRRLRVGYTRAGRLIDMLERRGIVGPYEGSKPRQIAVRPEDHERILDGLRGDGGFAPDIEGDEE